MNCGYSQGLTDLEAIAGHTALGSITMLWSFDTTIVDFVPVELEKTTTALSSVDQRRISVLTTYL